MTELRAQLNRLEQAVDRLDIAVTGMLDRTASSMAAVATQAAEAERRQILNDAQTVMREVDTTISQLELVLQQDDRAQAS